MKRFLFFLLVLSSTHVTATWAPFGPEGIQANRICFILDMHPHWGICHDGGLCLYDLVSQTWTDHPTILPVRDACYLDGEKILVIMGNGTDSDGIYQYDPVSDQFEVVQFIESPYFICSASNVTDFDLHGRPDYSFLSFRGGMNRICIDNSDEETYYVGHYFGLLSSSDGFTWTPVNTFTNKAIVAMDTYENQYVVSEMDNQYGIWYSSDSGNTWTLSSNSPMVSCLGFDPEGTLYGIFPDNSYSSGLWSSPDSGQTWEVEFWSVGMSCVGFDYTNVFVGWGDNPYGTDQGISWFHPETGLLTCINDNLPELVINQITHNPTMSAIALFCCTENGAYVSYDYYLQIAERPETTPSMSIQPNPATTRAVVAFRTGANGTNGICTVYYLTGMKVRQARIDLSVGNVVLDCSGFMPGIYIVELKGRDMLLIGKLIVN